MTGKPAGWLRTWWDDRGVCGYIGDVSLRGSVRVGGLVVWLTGESGRFS